MRWNRREVIPSERRLIAERFYMRHIDHIVVAVRELDRAAELYGRLGFQVGARNQHPWGTENRLIQFGTSFIELIAVGAAEQILPHRPRHFSFGAFVRDYLGQREGIAMLALSSTDAEADAVRFAEQGIGDFEPFFFKRRARRPDSSETQVAFTLAFAHDPAAPQAGFFVCQQHFPGNFWNTSFQRHRNSASGIAAVTLAASDPARHGDFLTCFSGEGQQALSDGRLQFALDGGRIEASLTNEAQRQELPSALFTSVTVRVGEIEAVRRLLRAEGIPLTASGETIVLAPSLLFGVELRFEHDLQH